ncbi:hypothetical protein D8674_031712 [Pyrus ussuriensis x Pyrus communis]|uniref:Uncharacterized protein n=1 Tax=Pyrus ussuriensis x Pyrus communis TaxID=2448454 RepID=A0A5N5F4S8_9ROSA|nr:hypothetical protein D8674_031712 [Pyrus ussuriensis x Pyrus communis]
MLSTKPSLNLADSPLPDFPAFLPDPLVRLPRPTSQHIPTFTPLMCDQIVHIPVIDICSSGARETLRRLLISGSTQNSPQLIDVLPAMLSNAHENRNVIVAGSRGLYSGTRDVDVIANRIAAMGLVNFTAWDIEYGKCFR